MDYPGIDGFLGTRASITLDMVFVALLAIIPILGLSIRLAKRGQYERHKRIQLTLAATLAAAVTLFEIDMRLVSGWRQRAMASPYYADATAGSVWTAICCDLLQMQAVPGWVFRALAVHLVFAISTTVLWIFVTAGALRRGSPLPWPSGQGSSHRFWGRLAAWDMVMTAASGWAFYWLAFVA